MYIKQLLTEAQADWAAMPYVENDKLEKLKNQDFCCLRTKPCPLFLLCAFVPK